jgi:hypothetical protein
MFKCISLFILFFSFNFLSAQVVESTSAETDWQIMKVNSYNAPSMEFYHYLSMKNAVLNIDKKGYVMPAQFEKNSFGLVCVDVKGNTKWQAVTAGRILDLAKSGENIIAVYSPDFNSFRQKRKLSTVFVALFDGKNGKLIEEQLVSEVDGDFSNYVKVLCSPDQQFTQLLIRISPIGKNIFNAGDAFDKQASTNKFKVVTFSPKLEMKSIDVNSAILNNFYEGCMGLSAEEFVVLSRAGNKILVEKFNLSSINSPEKLSVALTVGDKWRIFTSPAYSADQPNVVYFGVHYNNEDKQNIIGIAKADFNTKKAAVSEIVTDKKMGEELQNDPDRKKAKMKSTVDELDLMDVAILKDKVVLMTQVRYMSGGGSNPATGRSAFRFHNDQIVLTSFDNNLKKLNNKLIDRRFETFLESGEKAAWTVEGNKLHLLYNKNDGAARIGAEYVVVDLNNNSVEHRSELTRENIRKDASIETDAVVWQGGKALVPYNNMSGIKNGETVFQVISLKK